MNEFIDIIKNEIKEYEVAANANGIGYAERCRNTHAMSVLERLLDKVTDDGRGGRI